MTTNRDALEGILELCDQIRDLQERSLRDPEADAVRGAERREQLRDLRSGVLPNLRSLLESPRAQNLTDIELLALALLFHRRLAGITDPPFGGELVALLHQAGYSRTQALAALGPRSSLRRDGWLQAQAEGRASDPTDLRLLLAAEAGELFWPGEGDGDPAEVPPAPAAPYGAEEECLWDLHAWRMLCLQRAEALLEGDGTPNAPSPRLRLLRHEARNALMRIRARIAATPAGAEFRIERFCRQHRLTSDELLVVVHLLFCELVEGEPYISALECLRVIAESRTDLFRKRRVVSPKGRLRQFGILVGRDENAEYTKALAMEVSLADWAADEITAGAARTPRLDDKELDDFLRGDE